MIIDPTPSVGANLASSLGSGISQGLNLLVQDRMNQLLNSRQSNQASAFWKSLGLPEDVARSFASAPVEIQKNLFDRLEGLQIGTPSAMGTAPQERITDTIKESPSGIESTQKESLEAPLTLGPSTVERRHREQLAQKELASRFKETKDVRQDIVNQAKAARQDLKDLERLEELSQSGELDTPGYVEFLQRSGYDIPALMNPASEEFQKIQTNFLRNAKNYFGGRITNFEAEQFLKAIPSLSQSPEGRKRVIAGLKYVSRAALEQKEALKEILAENKGVPPYDLYEQVDDRVEKKLDSLAKKFKEDIAKPVPKGQNKFITALQAGLGSAIGGLGGLGKGAIKAGSQALGAGAVLKGMGINPF